MEYFSTNLPTVFHYFAMRSNHFSITSIVHIEMQHAITNTIQVNQMGIDS